MQEFNPTESKLYRLGRDLIEVKIENSTAQFMWQLIVNGQASRPTSYYEGIVKKGNYYLTTAYWEDKFPEFVPFTIDALKTD